jgi:exosortase family protein XrtM
VSGALRPIGPARYALRFAILFALLFAAFEAGRGTAVETVVVDRGVLDPAAALLHVLVPADGVAVRDRSLASSAARLRVLRGCEGIETVLLVVAAVLAFPASIASRLAGAFLGAALAWLLSVLRLAALYCSLRFWPGVFEVTHGLVAPLAPVALLALFFLAWSGLDGRDRPATGAIRGS